MTWRRGGLLTCNARRSTHGFLSPTQLRFGLTLGVYRRQFESASRHHRAPPRLWRHQAFSDVSGRSRPCLRAGLARRSVRARNGVLLALPASWLASGFMGLAETVWDFGAACIRCPTRVRHDHSAMLARCPVCPKADAAGRSKSTRPAPLRAQFGAYWPPARPFDELELLVHHADMSGGVVPQLQEGDISCALPRFWPSRPLLRALSAPSRSTPRPATAIVMLGHRQSRRLSWYTCSRAASSILARSCRLGRCRNTSTTRNIITLGPGPTRTTMAIRRFHAAAHIRSTCTCARPVRLTRSRASPSGRSADRKA